MDLATITWGQLFVLCIQVFGIAFGTLLIFDTLMGVGALLAMGWAALARD